MANTIISPIIFAREVVRNRDQKNVLMNYVNRKYEGELKEAGDVVTVQILPTLTMTPKSIVGAGTGTVGTGPGGAIASTNFVIKAEKLVVDKYEEIRINIRDIEIKQSNLDLTDKIAERVAEAEARMMDAFVRDIVLVDQIGDIPATNKINSTTPIALTKDNIIEQIEKMIVALDENNVHDNRVLFISHGTASLFRQSKLLDNTDTGLEARRKGYIGMYDGIQIVQTNALKASNEMIMMAKDAVNAVVQISKQKVTEGVDGFYENLLAYAVFGGKIFSENAKAIAVNYCV